ncbi:unnamed protein product [Cylicocyclus nassatus]|uniref:Uncharacterized protein n=1 Tax=Cylicocyclus nassatus TaxID=53992 RepID=A0AA36GQV0_CYLNA|nr:unnamed protein product [Cylicocyclus nassatus]
MSNIEDFKSPVQKEREARHKKICNDFKVISKEHPGLSKNKYCVWLGSKYGMTSQGIKEMCKQHYFVMFLAAVGFCIMLCFYDKASLDFDKGLRDVDERETGSDNGRTL